ncbi:hypothetical protein P3498_17885, partial [Vibrio parahaemolyticus]|nr:hypothetical protein [Vibrio parahaemolyticus]MDF4508533.1 hypothetical protein [Vibrio parahaemolyticus]MDF4530581.1 hypothetical protein [Vibrio parahaemolyticus]MDF4617690.1 hypothetical protein [Vibrio parahaemolyticus]MDF5657244.1 hypothetical protein [Vibrio parahaemolyticus]
AELVDAPDLGSGAARCESSSLSFRTIIENPALICWVFSFSDSGLGRSLIYRIKKASSWLAFFLSGLLRNT